MSICLLRSQGHQTTFNYVHLAHGYLIETGEKIGNIIAEAMENLLSK